MSSHPVVRHKLKLEKLFHVSICHFVGRLKASFRPSINISAAFRPRNPSNFGRRASKTPWNVGFSAREIGSNKYSIFEFKNQNMPLYCLYKCNNCPLKAVRNSPFYGHLQNGVYYTDTEQPAVALCGLGIWINLLTHDDEPQWTSWVPYTVEDISWQQ